MANQFGARFKHIRESRGLSQQQLADILGTTKQVLSRYETGLRTPKVSTVVMYARRLNISVGELTGYEESGFETLAEREQLLLNAFRAVPADVQDEILSALRDHQKKRQDRKG